MRSRRDLGVPVTSVADRPFFRWTDYDAPFWADANTNCARWHRVGDGATQYWSSSPHGAWAERVRWEELRSETDIAQIRTNIWIARFNEMLIVDYSTFASAQAAGFPADALVADDHTRCQVEGNRLRDAGYSGVMAPSAALPGVLSLTLFGPRVRSSWNSDALLRSHVPACIVAIGSPAPGLSASVRHFGAEHSGLRAYQDAATAESAPPDENGYSEKLF